MLLSGYRDYLLFIANQDLDEGLRAKFGASDVVQESLMSAQRKFEQFRGDSEPELLGWLRTILVNDLRNNRRQYSSRKRDADREVNLQNRSVAGGRLVDPKLTPSSDAMKRERAQALAAALICLTEDHRQVVQLRNFEQLDFAEVGRLMNRSPDAARKLWARAIESLQSHLAAESPDLFSGIFESEPQDD